MKKSKKDILNTLKGELKAKNIESIDDLFEVIEKDKMSSILSEQAQHQYLEFLSAELAQRANERKSIIGSEDLGNYLAMKYGSLKQEEFHVVCINNANKIINDVMVSKGNREKSVIDLSAIARIICENNAAGFFICHNHPSGKLLPSPNDDKMCERIKEVGNIFKISLLDSFIVGNGEYYSCAEAGNL